MMKPNILITIDRDDSQAEVTIRYRSSPDKREADFRCWLAACEYLMHKTAQKSSAGYEKAMELLVKGAMTWRDRDVENGRLHT